MGLQEGVSCSESSSSLFTCWNIYPFGFRGESPWGQMYKRISLRITFFYRIALRERDFLTYNAHNTNYIPRVSHDSYVSQGVRYNIFRTATCRRVHLYALLRVRKRNSVARLHFFNETHARAARIYCISVRTDIRNIKIDITFPMLMQFH